MRKVVTISRDNSSPVTLACDEVAYKTSASGALTVLLEGNVQWCSASNGEPLGRTHGGMVFSDVKHVQWTKGE